MNKRRKSCTWGQKSEKGMEFNMNKILIVEDDEKLRDEITAMRLHLLKNLVIQLLIF